jgi:2-dehydro-3-deoxyglucarate aldolase
LTQYKIIDMKNTTLKKKLKNKELSVGSWITIGNQAIVDVLAHAGFDWLCVDLEHTAIDYNELQILLGFIQSHDIAALVRVSKNEEVVIKKALDAGADGIIVPMICSGADARQAVAFAKYPPIGKRGVGLSRAQQYCFGFDKYKEWLPENLVVIAQVEHIEGINNIEDIITTDGIDGAFIGPYDLSASLGMPGQFNDPDVQAALQKFERVCRNNTSVGYHVIEPEHELVKQKIEAGYNFIAFSTDYHFMGRTAVSQMKKLNLNS